MASLLFVPSSLPLVHRRGCARGHSILQDLGQAAVRVWRLRPGVCPEEDGGRSLSAVGRVDVNALINSTCNAISSPHHRLHRGGSVQQRMSVEKKMLPLTKTTGTQAAARFAHLWRRNRLWQEVDGLLWLILTTGQQGLVGLSIVAGSATTITHTYTERRRRRRPRPMSVQCIYQHRCIVDNTTIARLRDSELAVGRYARPGELVRTVQRGQSEETCTNMGVTNLYAEMNAHR